MKNKIKVIQYGIGPIGAKITEFLLNKSSIEIVGAIDIDPQKTGRDLSEFSGNKTKLGISIKKNLEEVLDNIKPDIAVLTTSSSLEKITPSVMALISHGINVVSTCEELRYPWLINPALAAEIDEAAKINKVSVLSTGVNPGFLMDFLPSALTAVCRDIKKITVERIQNAQFRRIPFQKKIGAGLSMEQFQEKLKEGTLRHVGLTESIHLIASKIGWELEKTEDIIKPVAAKKNVKVKSIKIKKGNALGVKQIGRGIRNGEEVITLLFKAAIGEKNPRDRIIIDGTPKIDMKIKDGINGDIATCAITVNAIPAVIKAAPGLRTMADIETVSYFE
ncbi:MAG: dihydrodipicolinate reductase [Ignavibacteria bacterium]